MDGRLIRKRYTRRITFLAVSLSIGILLMGGVLLYLSSDVRNTWNNYSEVSQTRSNALAELHRAVGYGGFIHNFKNYVMRQETALEAQLQEDVTRTFAALASYAQLNLSQDEREALAQIESTFREYESGLRVAKQAIVMGKGIADTDRLVRVNDAKALAALSLLQAENNRFNAAISAEMNQQISVLVNFLLIGLLAMPFVVLAAYHYHDIMNRFVALMIEKKLVERELEDAAAQVVIAEENHQAMAYEAYHCELTRVPNRKAFMKKGQHILDEVSAKGDCLSVLFVDVDDFKTINDTFGHEVGDRVLVEVASRLSVAVREGDFVARIGGDEFAMIVRCPEAMSNYERLAERLSEAMNQSYEHLAAGLDVSCSVGGAFFPEEGLNLEALIRVADERMYRVKKSGKNGVYLQDGELG